MEAPPELSGWAGHVVVCGLHDEGLRVIELLDLAGVRVVAVDDAPDPTLVGALDAVGVPFLRADSRLPETLTAAGYAGAIALLCLESDDLHTLATALLAREIRPDARVVVQMRDAAVGRALEDVGVAVLDVAGLTAPSIVEGCLHTGRWSVRVGEDELVVAEQEVRSPGSLRELYGDLAPVAVLPSSGGEVVVTPGRDVTVVAGDTVVLLGSSDGMAREGVGLELHDPADATAWVGARAPRPSRPRRNLLVRDLLSGVDRGVKVAIAALVGLVVVSVGVLTAGYREPGNGKMSVLDALYFTVETIGTVGYGDFYFRDQPTWLRLWAIVLMVVGATLATVFFALLTNVLVSRRLEDALGRRHVAGLDDHVVVVGLGSIGLRVVEQLSAAEVDTVVVDSDPDNRFRGRLRALDVPFVNADATLPDTWADLHIDRARAVAVLTSSDLVNIETGLVVRDVLGPRWPDLPVLLRVFDRRLAGTVAPSFGFRFVRSTAALAAPWFVGAALGLDVVGTFYVGDQPMLVAQLTVAPGGGLHGLAMRELAARIRVVSIHRAGGSVERLPRRDVRFEGGDTAYVVGPFEELLLVLRR